MLFWGLIAGLLGWGAGTFVSHLAEAILARRALKLPACPYCQTPYHPLQWSAILALVTGDRRCRACERSARWPRFAGELLLALTWGLLVGRFGMSVRVLFAMVAAVPLTMILVTDLEAKIIPNRIVLPALGIVLVVGILLGPAVPGIEVWTWWSVPLGALLGFGVLWILASIGVALLGEGALGAGDVKLAALVGATVGFPMIVVALLLAIFLGGAGALLVLIGKRGSLRSAIPYGPFIVLGCVGVLIYGVELAIWFFG